MRQENAVTQQNKLSYAKRDHRAHRVARPDTGFRHTSRPSERLVGYLNGALAAVPFQKLRPPGGGQGRPQVRSYDGSSVMPS